MSIALTGSWWLAAFLAAAPGDGSRLEEYGGSYKCRDEVVKAQVVRALSSGGTPYQANAIMNGGHPEYDGKSVHVTIGKATSLVSKPGAANSPSSMRVKRSGAGAAMDVLMCRYRRASSKSWDKITTADLDVAGHLAKRMPSDVKGLGRVFALGETTAAAADSVIVMVATGVGGKSAELDVSVHSKGLQKRRNPGDVKAPRDIGKRILKEASDPKWEQYHYGEETSFPEAKDKVAGWEDREFDCSYFVWLVYNHVGIDYDFANTALLAQLVDGQFVEVKTPRPGDLVVWNPVIGSTINHVGIVAEDLSKFWDNSGSESVGLSDLNAPIYKQTKKYLRRKGL